MPIYPLTIPAHALPAVGFMLGHSTFHIKRLRHLCRTISPLRLIYSLTQRNQEYSAISQSLWELTRAEHRDTSNDNPTESGVPNVACKGARALSPRRVTPQLLAPKGLLLRLSLLKIKAKVYAHVLLDSDLRKWKDVSLLVEHFLWCLKFSQSGTTDTHNLLGFKTLLVEGKSSLRMADPSNFLF